MVFFSSSSRSMRSTKALRWSLAMRAAVMRSGYWAGATSGPPQAGCPNAQRRRQGARDLIHRTSSPLVLVGFLEVRLLVGARLALVFGLPLFVRHPVDELSALILRHGNVFGVGCFLHPVGQAVATEAS